MKTLYVMPHGIHHNDIKVILTEKEVPDIQQNECSSYFSLSTSPKRYK